VSPHPSYLAVTSILILACSLGGAPSRASEKVFLSANNSCYIAAGQVWGAVNKESFYSEVIGSLQGVPGQLCLKHFFDVRSCKPSIFYNFRLTCRGGTASTPQLYMAFFGKDQETQKNGFAANADQLSYIDPVKDFTGNFGRRVYLPPGYAPLNTTDINNFVRRLSWDDFNQRPALAVSPGSDQDRRIRDLFVVRGGYVEPFPESNIKKAIEISEEKPRISSPPVMQPTESVQHPGLYIQTNSFPALAGGVMFAALLSWVFTRTSRALSGDRPSILRQIIVESGALIISGTVLWWFGVVDEIKLLSIPLGAGLTVALISSMKLG